LKRPIGDSSQRSRNRRAKLRLFLEPLEARRLLAGLNISVLLDQDGSRSSDPADTAASGRLVYLDINHNRRQDESDLIAVTNDEGIAQFTDIAAGTYEVSLVGGSKTQKQTFPVSVEEQATQINSTPAFLFSSPDLTKVWSVDATGKARSLSGDRSLAAALPGPVSGSAIVGDAAWLIVTPLGQSSSILMRFDLATGQNQPLPFLGANGRAITHLVNAGSAVIARLTGPHGTELAVLKEFRGQVSAINPVSVSGSAKLYGSTGLDQIAIVEPITSTFIVSPSPSSTAQSIVASQLSLYNSLSLTRISTRRLRAEATEVAIGSNGNVFAAYRNAGVEVFSNDGTISEVAMLPEASAPLAANSGDNRLVTGNSMNKSELIVWDADTWAPIARTQLPEGGSASKLILSNDGDQWFATGAQGIFHANLAAPSPVVLTVLEGQVNTVQFGVRLEGLNSVPIVLSPTFQFAEDGTKSGQLRTIAQDRDSDTLWFSLLANPSHGRIELTPSGAWKYFPNENFNGLDQARIRVMDGQSATELTLTFNVTAVNDPPEQLEFKLDDLAIPEDITEGMYLGRLSVQDPDANANYRYSTSDSRFLVRDGQLYLAPGAQIDYEQESAIQLEVTAIDDTESGYQITSFTTINIRDTNEPPTAVRILDTTVPENSLGEHIGVVVVDDPDKTNQFEYTVSDSRFQIVDGKLALKPHVRLDYEAMPEIEVTVTADDGSSQPVSTTVKVIVTNQNDPPTGITISSTEIEENTPGAVVGSLAVVDQDIQAYTYSVSDPRFEVADGKLKLVDEHTITKAQGLTVILTVTATSGNSDTITETLLVNVNTPLPIDSSIDVNNDGEITPIDAILVISYLNKNGAGPKPEGTGSGEGIYDYDVNGDGIISPLDVLIIIRHLNARRSRLASGEGESTLLVFGSKVETSSPVTTGLSENGANMGQPLTVAVAVTNDISEVDFNASVGNSNACSANDAKSIESIDIELEGLLEQLSMERLKRKRMA
jgi:Dockerin type I domain/Bacterial Ig domain